MNAGTMGFRPLLSRSGCISSGKVKELYPNILFSSPFIEERLYFQVGADDYADSLDGFRPLLSRSGCIFLDINVTSYRISKFSSPFIEERLYLENFKNVFVVSFSALLSWSNIDQNNGLD